MSRKSVLQRQVLTLYRDMLKVSATKEGEAGAKIADLCRRHGISEPTFHRWKAKYGGMEPSDARKLKALEDENRRLKELVADLTLDNQALKMVRDAKPWTTIPPALKGKEFTVDIPVVFDLQNG